MIMHGTVERRVFEDASLLIDKAVRYDFCVFRNCRVFYTMPTSEFRLQFTNCEFYSCWIEILEQNA